MKEKIKFLMTLENYKILKLSRSKQKNDLYNFINETQVNDKDNSMLLLSKFLERVNKKSVKLEIHCFKNKKIILGGFVEHE